MEEDGRKRWRDEEEVEGMRKSGKRKRRKARRGGGGGGGGEVWRGRWRKMRRICIKHKDLRSDAAAEVTMFLLT